MTVVCTICKELLISREARVAMVSPSLPAGVDLPLLTEANEQAMDLMNFDLMMGTLAQHISNRHPDQNAELSAVMFLCGKLFATRWGISTAPNFETLRASWAAAILKELQPPAPASAPLAPSPAGSGSKPS